MINVYHAPRGMVIDSIFMSEDDLVAHASSEFEEYVLVAEVDTDSLDTAFRLTNNINGSWWDNDNVTPLFDSKVCRSTSVGDIVSYNDTMYVVASCGFKELK